MHASLGIMMHSMDDMEGHIDSAEPRNVDEVKKMTEEETSKSIRFRWKRTVKNVHEDDISLVFVAASLIAVFMDPFFVYIPLVQVKNNYCVQADRRLQTVALISRSITDFLFLWDMSYRFCKLIARGESKISRGMISLFPKLKGGKRKGSKRKLWRSITIDFLAILPIPQMLVAGILTKGTPLFGSQYKMGWNVLLLLQYGPRTYIIIPMLRKLKENSPIWFMSLLYIFTSLIASHIIGGFWYFTAIQKQLMCWYQTSGLGGQFRIVDCNDNHHFYSSGMQTMINRICSVNKGTFDYGMFSEGLKSPYMNHTVSGGKLLYFMWWGLKNLSTKGSDLGTSNNVWENCFAILVAIIGVALLHYLIGHMQQFLQLMADKREVSDKVRKKKQEWRKRKQVIPKELWKQIWPWMKYNLEKENDAGMEFLDCLPESLQNYLRKKMLKKVLPWPLENLDDKLLEKIYIYLKPVIYTQKKFIFRVGEPLDSMLYIVDGTVIVYTTSSSPGSASMIHEVVEGDSVYGRAELIEWNELTPLLNDTPDYLKNLPTSTKNVRCHTKVEGFVLTAKDFKTVLQELEKYKEEIHIRGTS